MIPSFVSISEQAQVASTVDLVGPAVIYPLAIAQIRQSQESGVVLILTTTGRAADELAADLSAYLPDEGIEVFPSWETLPHERLSPSADTVGRRMAVLRRLAHPIIGSVHAPPITALITSEPPGHRANRAAAIDAVRDALPGITGATPTALTVIAHATDRTMRLPLRQLLSIALVVLLLVRRRRPSRRPRRLGGHGRRGRRQGGGRRPARGP